MKKLLLLSLLFVSVFSLRGQAVFELQVLPVCWQYTENADSTLYAYWLMSSQSEVPRLISYLNVSGSVVAGVNDADISANPCCCGSGGGGDDGVGYRLVIASNGLNDFNPDPDSVDVELGGALERNTFVTGPTYNLSFAKILNIEISADSTLDMFGKEWARLASDSVRIESANQMIIKTPGVGDNTATNGQVLTLIDEDTGEVEYQSAAADNHLGTDDQTLTGNRTTDFGTFFYTWDLRDAILDQFAHPVLSPDNRILGWYVADGAGDMSWITNTVASSTFRRMVFNDLGGNTFLSNDLDRTYIDGDKIFLSPDTLDTDNTLTALLGRDQVTGEIKELEVSSIAGGGTESAAAQFIAPQDTLVFDNNYYYQPRIFPAGGLTYTVDTTGSKYGATIMAKVQSDTLPILFDLQWFDTTQMYNISSGDTLTGTHNVYFEYTPYGVAVSVPTNSGFAASNDTTSNPPSNFTLPEGYPATVGTLEFELDGRFNISEVGDTVFWKSTVDTLDYFYNDVLSRKPDIITNGLLLDADDWLEAGPTAPFTHNTDPDGYSITYAINPSNANYSVITRADNETDRILAKNGNTDYCGSVVFTGQGGTTGLKVVTIDIPPTGTARLYINGVEVSTDTTVGADARNATFDRIGRMEFEDFYLDGEIKYLALNRFTASGITATEAQNIFIHVNERILNEAL